MIIPARSRAAARHVLGRNGDGQVGDNSTRAAICAGSRQRPVERGRGDCRRAESTRARDRRRRRQVLGIQCQRTGRRRHADAAAHAGRRQRPDERRRGDRGGRSAQLRGHYAAVASNAGDSTSTANSATARRRSGSRRSSVSGLGERGRGGRGGSASHLCVDDGGRRQVLGPQRLRPARRRHDDAATDAGRRQRFDRAVSSRSRPDRTTRALWSPTSASSAGARTTKASSATARWGRGRFPASVLIVGPATQLGITQRQRR